LPLLNICQGDTDFQNQGLNSSHRLLYCFLRSSLSFSETGLASIFLFHSDVSGGLPPFYLILGFLFATLVVATLLIPTHGDNFPNLRVLAIYFMRRQIKRQRGILFDLTLVGMCYRATLCCAIHF
jgi:hypothetical protein